MALPDWLSDLLRDEPLWKQVGILKQSVRQIEIWRTEEFAADLEQRLAKREKQIHEEWNRWIAETEKSVRARVEAYGAQHSLSQTEKTDTMPVSAIDKMLGYTNLESEKGFDFFQKFMRERGVLDRLGEMGVEEGDTIEVAGIQFEYYR